MKRSTIFFLFLLLTLWSNGQNFAVSTYSNPKCFGDCDGTITFTTSSVQGPFTAVITNTGSCPNSTVQNSTANSITINNICGCAATYSFAIYNPSMALVGTMVHQIINYATAPLDINSNTVTATSCSNCCDGNITFSVSGGNLTGAPTYSIDGTFTANVNPLYFTCAGTHTICVKDVSECVKCKTFVMPYQGMPTTVEEQKLSEGFLIIPNPFNDFIHIIGENKVDYVTIRDLTGKIILNQKIEIVSEKVFSIDMSEFSSGLYLVELNSENGNVIHRMKAIKSE